MNEFKKEEKKGGFWAFLSSLFGRGANVSGGVAGLGSAGSGFGSAFGLGGLFATKAGVVGMILGCATIAAGIGVVYNFIGPSSKSVYTPQLFQDTYYEEQSRNAGLERAKQKGDAAASASTLDMFREQARKDGLGAQDGAEGEKKDASAEDAAAGDQAVNAGASGAPAAPAPNAPAGGGRLRVSAGFGGTGDGSSSRIMAGSGGMFGGMNGQFVSGSKPSAGQGVRSVQGKSSSMKGSPASAINSSSKRAVPNFNKKGSFSQAQFARAQGVRSAGLSGVTASRIGATEAFSGETTGTGDIGSATGGVGVGGAGVSGGSKLKASDPSLTYNESQLPKLAPPVDVSPWGKFTDMALYGMVAGAALVLASSMLAKYAQKLVLGGPVGAIAAGTWYTAAVYAAYAAMVAALAVVYAGFMLMNKYGQTWMGVMYMAAGAMLIWKAYAALSGAQSGRLSADGVSKTVRADSAANGGIKTPTKVPGSSDIKIEYNNGKSVVYDNGGSVVGGPAAPAPTQSIASIPETGYGSNMDSLL